MKFSIITPSYRNLPWLRLCVASVADQEGVEHEHIVQDACSDDGTQDWLPRDPRVRAFIEPDAGMYDAVNRGFRRATGDVFAYLNCDEQYLPGALRAVAGFMEAHPEVDVVLPDLVVTKADGAYLCHRLSMVPIPWHIWYRANVTTSSVFIRRRVFFEHGLWFDPRWRALGDFFWMLEACRRRLRWAELRYFASVFTETGENLCLQPGAQREFAELQTVIPRGLRLLRPLVLWHHRWRMLRRGAFTHAPFNYCAYTLRSPEARVDFRVDHPTGIWRTRMPGAV